MLFEEQGKAVNIIRDQFKNLDNIQENIKRVSNGLPIIDNSIEININNNNNENTANKVDEMSVVIAPEPQGLMA